MSYSAWHTDTQRCPHLPLFNPDGYLPYLLPTTPSLLKVAKVVFYYLLYLTNAKSPITCELITYDMLGLHLASLAVTLIDIASEEEKQSGHHLDSWLSRISIGKDVSPLRTLLTVHFSPWAQNPQIALQSITEMAEELAFSEAFQETSVVVQWLRIHFQVQGTWVRSMVREILHALEQLSPSATTTGPTHHNGRSHVPQLRPDAAK